MWPDSEYKTWLSECRHYRTNGAKIKFSIFVSLSWQSYPVALKIQNYQLEKSVNVCGKYFWHSSYLLKAANKIIYASDKSDVLPPVTSTEKSRAGCQVGESSHSLPSFAVFPIHTHGDLDTRRETQFKFANQPTNSKHIISNWLSECATLKKKPLDEFAY